MCEATLLHFSASIEGFPLPSHAYEFRRHAAIFRSNQTQHTWCANARLSAAADDTWLCIIHIGLASQHIAMHNARECDKQTRDKRSLCAIYNTHILSVNHKQTDDYTCRVTINLFARFAALSSWRSIYKRYACAVAWCDAGKCTALERIGSEQTRCGIENFSQVALFILCLDF